MRHLLSLALAPVLFSSATMAAILDVDFSTYANGDLVGQNGWAQFGTTATAPLQVSGGAVRLPTATADQQDAVLSFANQISAPLEGSSTLYFAVQVSVTSTGANPSYFAALTTLTGSSTASNFANARLATRLNAETSLPTFGTRVTGQAGYPFAYGADRAFTTTYNLIAEINLVAGAQNDTIRLFVQPTNTALDLTSVYATSVYGSGTATDPTFGGLVLSQFASTTVQQSEVSVFRALVTQDLADVEAFALGAIPEPSAAASLAGLAALAAFALSRSRRAKA
jgi:hypothetical protein